MGDVLKHLLGEFYNVCCLRSGAEALAFLDSAPPVSLIICDVMMPGMSGFAFRERLAEKESLRDLPFVFLTALADPEERLLGLKSGALDYIRKPFSGDELLLKVRNILAVQNTRYRQALSDGKAAERIMRIASGAEIAPGPDDSVAAGGSLARFDITGAERRVLELLRLGLQDKEIAERLSLSPRTVSSHLVRLYQKTETGNRVELLKKLYSPRV
jgi:DNA-binding NarL/FixJ family response regulator